MMSTFKMSAKHCSFRVFPMKVIFHCLLHEVNICDLKWDPESNILCAAYEDATVITGRSRVPPGLRTFSLCLPALPFYWGAISDQFWLLSFVSSVLWRQSQLLFYEIYQLAGCGSQELARQSWLWVQQLVYSPNTQNTNTMESQLHCHLHLYT